MATTATVGLTATLDITDFQRNAATYMRTLQQMQQAASQTQSSTTSSFSQMGSLGGGVVPALNSIAMGFGAIGAAATAAAVGGVAYLSASSLQMASDFEQGLADIAARMRETVDGITPLRDEIFSIALDPSLKVSLTDASDAALQLGSAGITMSEQIGGALQSTIEFQNAVGGDFGLASNVAISAMDAFNLKSNQLGFAVDGATGAINRSKLDLQKYAYVIANAGTSFAGFGGTLAQLNTVAAATASMFVSGQKQGTGMAEMMNRMAVPTDKAQKRMKELGLTFWDNEGKAKNLYNIVDELRARLSTLSKEEQRTALVNIFGKQGGPAMIALLQKTGAELLALEKEVNASGQAADAAATRMDTLQGAFGGFYDLLTATATSVAGMFVPALTAGFQSINAALLPIVTAFDQFGLSGVASIMNMSRETIKLADTIDQKFKAINDALMKGGIIAAINEMGISTQSLAIGFNALVGAAQGLLILGTVATGFAAITFAMTPLGAALIGLTTGAALLGAAWRTNFYNIQGITGAVMQFVVSSIADASKIAWGLIDQIGTITQKLMLNMSQFTQSGIATWLGIWERGTGLLYTGLAATFRALPQPVLQAMKQVYDIIKSGIDSAIAYVNSGLSSISSMTGAAMPQIGTPISPIGSSLQSPFSPTMGEDMTAGFASFTAMFEQSNQVIPPYIAYVEQAKLGTTAFGLSATESGLAFADYQTDVLSSADANKKLGQSAEQAAKQIEAAKEKINDNGVSMANLRGEMQGLEAQYPGLTAEVIRNFNAHIAAGGSVASFGDQLGATEHRQMFNYLAKLNDMDAANQALIASNGIVATSVVGTGDGFRDQYLTMATGLTPVVTATDALSLAVTNTTTTALPALTTSLNESVTPAINTTGIAADTLANTQFSGLQSQISTMLNPSLGQLNTQLSEQVAPSLTQTGIRADEMTAAFQRAIDKNKLFFESNNLVIVSLKNERKAVEDLIKYYEELYKAKLRAANTSGATPAPSAAPSGAPAPSQTFPQFAKGGSFVVPSGYPTSSTGMGIGVHSGELVKVFTAQQTRQMKRLQANNRIVSSSNTSSDNSRVVNFNITTQQPSTSVLRDLAFAKAKYGVI